MKGWKEYTFNDAVECNPKVSIKKGEIVENCEMEDIEPNYKYLYPREGKLYKGSNSKFQNGDTVFARITPCLENGKIAQIKRLKKNAGIGSTEFFVFRGKKNISDNDFVFYLSKTNVVRDTAVNSMTGASGRQRADIKAVKKISLHLPPLHTQQRIASILSAYDDLIEVNNQRIKLLEQTARELYKEWFVRMRFPATADSPGYKKTKFKKGVPEGWVVIKLKEHCAFKYGTMPKPNLIRDTGYPIFSGYGIVGFYEKYMFEKRTLIVVARGVGGTGDVKLTPEKCWLTNLSIAIFPDEIKLLKYFLYYTLYAIDLRYLDSGSAQSQITIIDLGNLKLPIPNVELQKEFEKQIIPIEKQKEIFQQQNTQLRQIRDRLLPRLISGKLRVSELGFV